MAWGDPYLYGWVNGDLQERLRQGRHSQTAAASATVPVLNSSWPMPPQKTLQHQQVTLVQSPVESLLLSSESSCLQGFVCALQDWSLCFPQSCGSLVIKSCWPSRSDSLGIPSPFVESPGWEAWQWGLEPSQQWENFFGIIVLQFVDHPPSRYGIWFYCICTPPFILLWFPLCLWMWGIFFLGGGPSILLSMVVQQLVAIFVLSQEMSTCPSMLPSSTGHYTKFSQILGSVSRPRIGKHSL